MMHQGGRGSVRTSVKQPRSRNDDRGTSPKGPRETALATTAPRPDAGSGLVEPSAARPERLPQPRLAALWRRPLGAAGNPPSARLAQLSRPDLAAPRRADKIVIAALKGGCPTPTERQQFRAGHAAFGVGLPGGPSGPQRPLAVRVLPRTEMASGRCRSRAPDLIAVT